MAERYLGPVEIEGHSSAQEIEALFEAPNEVMSLGSFVIRNIHVVVWPLHISRTRQPLPSDHEALFEAQKITRTLTQYNTVKAANDNGYADRERAERISVLGSLSGIDQAVLAIPAQQHVDFTLGAVQVLRMKSNEKIWQVRAQLPVWQGTKHQE